MAKYFATGVVMVIGAIIEYQDWFDTSAVSFFAGWMGAWIFKSFEESEK